MKRLISFVALCIAVAVSQESCDEKCEPKMKPVCGSDMKQYDNLCELKKAACLAKKNDGKAIELDYHGRCCKWNCDDKKDGMNVCGSDGMTYMHMCHLKYSACVSRRMGARLFAAHTGPCDAMCSKICPFKFKPVCGSDGQTYTNKCTFLRHKCVMNLLKHNVEIAHNGACFQKCYMSAKCPCDYKPVCGSDGQTYGNECELNVKSCHRKLMGKEGKLEVEFKGECDDTCASQCSPYFKPVCGSDGKTYANECLMGTANCLLRVKGESSRIRMKSEGQCNDSCPDMCPYVMDEVCGSDGKTYFNPCQLSLAACMRKKAGVEEALEIKHKGYCMTSCERVCPPKKMPVCGSDWKTYDSQCHLKEESCKRYKKMKADWDKLEAAGDKEKMEEFKENGWQPLRPLFVGMCKSSGPWIDELLTKCGDEYNPLCACNGKTYLNKCHVMIENFIKMKTAGYGVFPMYKGVCRRES